MNAPNHRLRRATLDDLPALGPLLQATLLPASQLEKRLTEFHVVEDSDGQLAGALGLQIAGQQGKIHSESYADFGLVDTLRPLLWERMQSVAQTHGLLRLWTLETAPFWKQGGFIPVPSELRTTLPAAFGDTKADWLTVKLKDDVNTVLSLDQEFTVFMQAEKARTEEVFAQARIFKGLAYVLGIALFICSIWALFRFLQRSGVLAIAP